MPPKKTKTFVGMGEKRVVSRSVRAGVLFPVGRIDRYLRKGTDLRVSGGAAVYLAGVLEYLTSELCELSGTEAIAHKKKRITARHI